MMLFDEPIFRFNWRTHHFIMLYRLCRVFCFCFCPNERARCTALAKQGWTNMHNWNETNDRKGAHSTAAAGAGAGEEEYWIAIICALKLIAACNLIYTHYTLASNFINIIQYTWQCKYSEIKFHSLFLFLCFGCLRLCTTRSHAYPNAMHLLSFCNRTVWQTTQWILSHFLCHFASTIFFIEAKTGQKSLKTYAKSRQNLFVIL